MNKWNISAAALVILAAPSLLMGGFFSSEGDAVSPECVNPITGENPCLTDKKKVPKAAPVNSPQGYQPLKMVTEVPREMIKTNPMNGMPTKMAFPFVSEITLKKWWDNSKLELKKAEKWVRDMLFPKKMVNEKKAPTLFVP
jgi:hypothetical protein